MTNSITCIFIAISKGSIHVVVFLLSGTRELQLSFAERIEYKLQSIFYRKSLGLIKITGYYIYFAGRAAALRAARKLSNPTKCT